MQVRWLQVGVGLGCVLALAPTPPQGCTPISCYHGTLPMDGATNVDPEEILELRLKDFRSDAPSFEGRVRLEHAGNGRSVPVGVTLDVDTGTLFVVPVEPLEPGEYRMEGPTSPDTAHWWPGFGPSAYARITFEVGGEPVLRYAGVHPENDTLLLAFSEAVDARSVVGALDIAGDPAYTVFGHLDGDERIVEVGVDGLQAFVDGSGPTIVATSPATARQPYDVVVDGVETPSGQLVAPSEPLLPSRDVGLRLLDLYSGEPYCEY